MGKEVCSLKEGRFFMLFGKVFSKLEIVFEIILL